MRTNPFVTVWRHASVPCFPRVCSRLALALVAASALIAGTAGAGTLLISNGSPVRILVPTDESLNGQWIAPAFDDSTWLAGSSGVGFEVGAGGYSAVIVADSAVEWSAGGRQGENYWFNGYYNRTADADGVYDPGTDFNYTDPNWTFLDGAWQLGVEGNPAANPPWDNIQQTFIHPNGINNGAEHWPMRRWISTYSGEVTIQFRVRKDNGSGTGVTGKIFRNGTELFSRAIAGNDTGGFTVLLNATLSEGDILDFAHTPVGDTGDTNDGSDGSHLTVRIIAGTLVEPVATADTQTGWGSGAQGENNWFYGYYNQTTDADGTYDPASDFNNTNPDWVFNGGIWQLGAGGNPTANPPWSNIGQTQWHPNGNNNVNINWVIKRWVSTIDGDINVRVQFGKQNTGGGNGTTLRLFHNGVEKFTHTVGGTDGTGIDTFVILPGVQVGDLVEFALDPVGTDGLAGDGSDGSRLRATIYPGAVPFRAGLAGDINTDLESAMHGVNSSVYLRFPFAVADPTVFDTLRLKMKFNDGYVAYLNGVEIDKRNAQTEIVGVTHADSVADWSTAGVQGENGWFYGYYNLSADGDFVYQSTDFTAFPSDGGGHSPTDFWTGSVYDWFQGNPPWTMLGREESHPSAINNGAEHWPIRRWVSEVDGDLSVRFKFRKQNVNCGDGVIGKIFHNGVEVYSQAIAGNDGVGRDDTVVIPGVLAGDPIDIMISPGPSDGCDGTLFSAVIFSGVPAVPWNGVAESARTVAQSIVAAGLDITAALPSLNAGPNVLAIHGVNLNANDGTFLIAPELVANRLPVAGFDSVEATQPFAAEYTVAGLMANDADPDGDIVLFLGVSSASDFGGSVQLVGDTIRYAPALGFDGLDSFSYTITDGSGIPVTGNVDVVVYPDTTPPAGLGASARFSLNQVAIRFSEPMDDVAAEDPFNYFLPDGLVADSAVLSPDRTTVILTLQPGQILPLTGEVCIDVIGQYDVAGNAMPDANLCFTMSFAPCYAKEELWFGIGAGSTIADLINNPAYPDFPSTVRYRALLETVPDQADQYGTRISGWLNPPESGNYQFAISSDDASEFWLSTDADPANKVLLAFEPVWNGQRDWLGTARRNPDAPENSSSTLFPDGIPMVAGQLYYFEALMKEGGGGDNLAVTWKLPSEAAITADNLPISGRHIQTLVEPLGATLAITQQPQDIVVALPAQPTATFAVAVDASFTADVSAPVLYQWQRDDGAGWADIPGANAAEYSFQAKPEDDGAAFRVVLCFPGIQATSDVATLDVIFVNVAPSFTPGQDVSVEEDTGLVVIPDWATDIDPGRPEEADQVLAFIVTADQPELFAEQPQISPEGTLTFWPAAGRCGVAQVTVVLQDDGGTADGGQDTSAPAEFTVVIRPVNDCPVAEDTSVVVAEGSSVAITLLAADGDAGELGCGAAPNLRFWIVPPAHGRLQGATPNLTYTPDAGYCGADSFLFLVDDGICFARGLVTIEVQGANDCPEALAQSVSTCEDTPVAILLAGSDPDEAGCGLTIQGFAVVEGPSHGTLSGTPPELTYVPAADFAGTDSFTFTVTDGECVSEPATVTITVRPGNDGPACHIVVGPRLELTPDSTETLVLACDNWAADVVLDATLCVDPEGDGLTYLWLVDGLPAGTEALQAATLELGLHEITLVVTDNNPGTGECATGNASSTCSLWVTVIDGCEAAEGIVLLVEGSDIHQSLKRTLDKELKDACKQFAKGKCKEGVKQLESFQDKVRHYDEFYKQPSKKLSAKKRIEHETAELLVNAAQALIDAYAPCDCMGRK